MPSIRHEVVIAAPAEQVFDAITTREGLSGWWTPDVEAQPLAGSVARFGFGPVYFKKMEIIEISRPRRLAWKCIAGEPEWIDTLISFDLLRGDGRSLLAARPEAEDQLQQHEGGRECTLLTLTQGGWRAPTPMFAECNYTWAQFLRSLRLLCETGRGSPFPSQHSLVP